MVSLECTKPEELSLCFPWRYADSDRQQLSRKSGKAFCHRKEKPAVFHLTERSRRRCCCLFDYQHCTDERHWCQRISDEHLPHRWKTVAAENWIKQPPENVARLREKVLRGLILFAGTRSYFWGSYLERVMWKYKNISTAILSKLRWTFGRDKRIRRKDPLKFILMMNLAGVFLFNFEKSGIE